MVAAVGIGRLELDALLPPQAERLLQAKAHMDMRIGHTVEMAAIEVLRPVVAVHAAGTLALRNAERGVVCRDPALGLAIPDWVDPMQLL
ncbi:MAG: hypothetical protein QHC90_02895 [Shinella sp.]|nr:hypothetical protein [Shinella sp.]